MQQPITSIIISVYKDSIALGLILKALEIQSSKNFEIIVSEDGNCEDMKKTTENWSSRHDNFYHLTQDDIGFRKNRALNRAIAFSHTEHLIFIDGDCIPHPFFIEAHQAYMTPSHASAGRRTELGPKISNEIRNGKLQLARLFNPFLYLLLFPRLLTDKTNHPGQGITLKSLQRFTENRHIRILGCNFSCHKDDLNKINGFNEDFVAAGWGEDSDIEWRLRYIGVDIHNTKFSAIQYHLYHERWYELEDKNLSILENSMRNNSYYCERGLSLHNTENINL
ncbi:MAG: glycosyltransferase [Gammaproteobacteria bacterium]|nr:glycosyltransferase [Gammaproteobacteria bacterium]MCK5262549.1 glycosyltransferase [Gammaproteobacteria bacterium]